MTTVSRRRILFTLMVPLVIGMGLLSRRSEVIHAVFGKYPGDSLWTIMVYCIISALAPRLSQISLAVIALAISFSVEFSQCLQYPWLVSIRSTTAGHLVLGSTFHPPDLVAYTVGSLGALTADVTMTKWWRNRT